MPVFRVDGLDNFLQVFLVVLISGKAQNFSGLVNPLLLYQPARAARYSKQQQAEQGRRKSSNSELPAPLCIHAEMLSSHQEIREIGQQNSPDYIELEDSHQTSSPVRRRDFRNVHRAQHRGTADAESADETEDYER